MITAHDVLRSQVLRVLRLSVELGFRVALARVGD